MTTLSPVTADSPPLKLSNSVSLTSDDESPNDGILTTFAKMGYQSCTKVADTLQGQICKVARVTNNGEIKTSVIKVTNKHLHQISAGVVKGRYYSVKENILLEQSILKYLTQDTNCPNSIVKFKSFFQTKSDYCMVMEDGGQSLFDFIHKTHKLLRRRLVKVSHWKIVCQIIFKQMIECIRFIHSKNVVHFDISCENFVINDVGIIVHQNYDGNVENISFDIENIQIKLCDFGLAQKFTNSVCKSSRNVGKSHYKSPEIMCGKKRYNAIANDVWAFGMCIFMCLTGGSPWETAQESDESFVWGMTHGIDKLLRAWNLTQFVNEPLCHILQSIFVFEEDRITLDKIQKYFDRFVYNV